MRSEKLNDFKDGSIRSHPQEALPSRNIHQKASRLLVYHYTVYGEESQTILRGDAMKTFKRILQIVFLSDSRCFFCGLHDFEIWLRYLCGLTLRI